VQLEERDLMVHFGKSYARYRSQVPMLMPRLLTRRWGRYRSIPE
jgi:protein-S-isoprenylcysteine O-methyltransferase Ste14